MATDDEHQASLGSFSNEANWWKKSDSEIGLPPRMVSSCFLISLSLHILLRSVDRGMPYMLAARLVPSWPEQIALTAEANSEAV